MRKTYFVIMLNVYIGTNQFDEKASLDDGDIKVICESLDDAYLYIDRMLKFNNDANNKKRGENEKITYTVKKPDFFEGRQVIVTFKDSDKIWTWEFNIFERKMFDPELDKFNLKL